MVILFPCFLKLLWSTANCKNLSLLFERHLQTDKYYFNLWWFRIKNHISLQCKAIHIISVPHENFPMRMLVNSPVFFLHKKTSMPLLNM